MLEIYYKEHLGPIDSFVIHLEFFKCEGFKTCVQYEIMVIFFLLLPLLKGGQEEAMTKFSIVPKKKTYELSWTSRGTPSVPNYKSFPKILESQIISKFDQNYREKYKNL